MNELLVKQILSTLNRDAFLKFIYELWKLKDISTDLEYQKTKPIKSDLFEQYYWGKTNKNGIYDYQGYNLIVPFFQPIELFSEVSERNLVDTDLIKKLKRYNSKIVNRESSWQFWTDGRYNMPRISFVTNFEGIDKDFYFDNIIPKFEHIIDNVGLNAETAVGSCDTFFELDPQNTLLAFNNFIEKYKKQISISLSGGKLEFEYFSQDKYLTSGLLKNSKNPYEPIFVNKKAEKSEIIKEFEFLINKNTSEGILEKFLTQYYREIFGEQYDRIETQLWLKFSELDIFNKNRRLDIFLRNSVERDWELFELKNVKKLTRTYRDIPTFTSEIHNAIQQIRNYEKLLLQDKVKQKFAKEGIEYFYPDIRLVVGNRPDISDEQWRFLKSTNENRLKIITYDELLSSMKKRYEIKTNNAR
jgi:hypothetical protein